MSGFSSKIDLAGGTTFPQTQEKTLENPAHSEEFIAVITLTQKNKHQVGDPQAFMRKSIVHICNH